MYNGLQLSLSDSKLQTGDFLLGIFLKSSSFLPWFYNHFSLERQHFCRRCSFIFGKIINNSMTYTRVDVKKKRFTLFFLFNISMFLNTLVSGRHLLYYKCLADIFHDDKTK